jgi:hypothetical protein
MDNIKYDTTYIIGNTYENIVDKYGDFDVFYDFKDNGAEGAYLVKERYLNGLPLYYYVVFDDNKKAYKTYLAPSKGA